MYILYNDISKEMGHFSVSSVPSGDKPEMRWSMLYMRWESAGLEELRAIAWMHFASQCLQESTYYHLYSQSHGFSSHVWMWELDNKKGWVPKNWYFRTVVLEKTLESPLDCKEILKEVDPEYSLEGLMLKLKLQNFGHLIQRGDSLEKTLMLKNVEGRRRRGQQRMSWLDGITALMDMS